MTPFGQLKATLHVLVEKAIPECSESLGSVGLFNVYERILLYSPIHPMGGVTMGG